MIKIEEIRDKSDEQLEFRLSEIDRESYDLTNELKSAYKLEKPHLLRDLKKEKARILTVRTERKKKIRG